MKIGFGTGLVFGLLGGTIYSLLTVKRSGRENRDILAEYMHDVQADFAVVQEDLDNLQALSSQLKETNLPQVQAFGQEVQSSVNDLEAYAKPRIRDIKARTEDMQDYVKSQAEKF